MVGFILIELVVLAFIMEYIDSSIGGGYGTVLSPVLLLMGHEALVIVPAILLSEILTGFTVGLLHNRASKIEITKNPIARMSLLILCISGLIGTITAVYLSISLPSLFVKYYIGIIVVVMGLMVIWKRNGNASFSRRKIIGLGVLCSFNKGISGGGYGPVAVSGQMLSGVETKAAISVTSISEAFVCVIGLIGYLLTVGISNWSIAISICLGAILATPLSAFTVSRAKERKLITIIGIAIVLIGSFTLYKLIFM